MSLYLSKNTFINFLFSFIPLSFIAGNLILNLNIFLFIIFAIIFYGREIKKIKFHFLDKVMLIFFIYIILVGFFNSFQNFNVENLSNDFTMPIKSILFLRYLLLYFVIRYLINNNIINFKFFFITSSLCSLFVCFDLIYQFYFGKDIFGFQAVDRRLSGPFGNELIAGSYLQRFSIFTFFLLPVFFNIKNKNFLFFIILILFSLITISLILAGNRIPFIAFITMIFLIILFEKNNKKLVFPFIFLLFSIFLISYNSSVNIKKHFGHFHSKIIQMTNIFSAENLLNEEEIERFKSLDASFYTFTVKGKTYKMTNTHLKEFKAGYVTWLQNKYIGGGIKSFKKNCAKAKINNCGIHPHNYYLEVLAELGLIGFFVLSIIIVIIIYNSLLKKYFSNSNSKYSHIITPFMFLFFAELFPIRSSGSFFTTSNATFIFLVIAVTISLARKEKLN
jgi:O-antigen ligase